MGPQYRRHSAGGDPAAGGEARCDPARGGRIRRVLHLPERGDLTMIPRSAALGDRPSLAIRLHPAITLLDRFPLSILQLMFRVAIAAVFWSSGLTKIASWATTVALFRDEYMVP